MDRSWPIQQKRWALQFAVSCPCKGNLIRGLQARQIAALDSNVAAEVERVWGSLIVAKVVPASVEEYQFLSTPIPKHRNFGA